MRDSHSQRGRKWAFWLPMINGAVGVLLLIMWSLLMLIGQIKPYPNEEFEILIITPLYLVAFLLYAQIAFLFPAFAAGSIAGEREQQTLEFLLMTPMTAREIFIGKWCAVTAPYAISLLILSPLCLVLLLADPGSFIIGLIVWTSLVITLVIRSLLFTAVSALSNRVTTAMIISYAFSVCGSDGCISFFVIIGLFFIVPAAIRRLRLPVEEHK